MARQRMVRQLGMLVLAVVLCTGLAQAAELAELLDQPWYPKAPPLPKPTGDIVNVATVAQLVAAVRGAKDDQTILVADGLYKMTRSLQISGVNRVMLRGASGDPRKVVLDFAKAGRSSAIGFRKTVGSGVAYLTVANRPQNGIKINSNTGVHRITIYNCIIRNVWQRPIKGVGVPDTPDGKPQWTEGCKVQYCLIYNDRPKRKGDDKGFDDRNPSTGFNYIAGMDIMAAKDWIISDNVFLNIRGGTGSARGAIFMWNGCKDVVIERNIIIDCDSGICLGNSSNRKQRRHCEGFIVRNNFITRCPEKNLLAVHTRDCTIVNNTVYDPGSRLHRQMRVVFANDGLRIANNLFVGTRILRQKVTGAITVENNVVTEDVAGWFVDPRLGNLHLTAKAAGAIDKATVRKDVSEDIDGESRGEAPDAGADELQPVE